MSDKIVTLHPGRPVEPTMEEIVQELNTHDLEQMDVFRKMLEGGEIDTVMIVGLSKDGMRDATFISTRALTRPTQAVGSLEMMKSELVRQIMGESTFVKPDTD